MGKRSTGARRSFAGLAAVPALLVDRLGQTQYKREKKFCGASSSPRLARAQAWADAVQAREEVLRGLQQSPPCSWTGLRLTSYTAAVLCRRMARWAAPCIRISSDVDNSKFHILSSQNILLRLIRVLIACLLNCELRGDASLMACCLFVLKTEIWSHLWPLDRIQCRDEARAHRQDEGAPDDTRLSSKVTTSASLEEGSQRWAHAWRTQGINVCLPLVPLVGCAALWSLTLLCSVPLPSGVGSRKAKGGQ